MREEKLHFSPVCYWLESFSAPLRNKTMFPAMKPERTWARKHHTHSLGPFPVCLAYGRTNAHADRVCTCKHTQGHHVSNRTQFPTWAVLSRPPPFLFLHTYIHTHDFFLYTLSFSYLCQDGRTSHGFELFAVSGVDEWIWQSCLISIRMWWHLKSKTNRWKNFICSLCNISMIALSLSI